MCTISLQAAVLEGHKRLFPSTNISLAIRPRKGSCYIGCIVYNQLSQVGARICSQCNTSDLALRLCFTNFLRPIKHQNVHALSPTGAGSLGLAFMSVIFTDETRIRLMIDDNRPRVWTKLSCPTFILPFIWGTIYSWFLSVL